MESIGHWFAYRNYLSKLADNLGLVRASTAWQHVDLPKGFRDRLVRNSQEYCCSLRGNLLLSNWAASGIPRVPRENMRGKYCFGFLQTFLRMEEETSERVASSTQWDL